MFLFEHVFSAWDNTSTLPDQNFAVPLNCDGVLRDLRIISFLILSEVLNELLFRLEIVRKPCFSIISRRIVVNQFAQIPF